MRSHTVAAFLAALLVGVATLVSPVETIASSQTFYVATTGTASAPGRSCSNPGFVGTDESPIQAAVDAATSGDVVIICPGTYALTAVIDLSGVDITLRGASAASTILDGGNTFGVDGSSNNDGVQIVFSDSAATLDSLTLRHGYSGDQWGGAAHIEHATVINTRFERNFAVVPGGALHGYDLVIRGSLFESNESTAKGGAVNAFHDVLIESTTFHDNASGWEGGALSVTEGGGSAVINRSTFSDNSADFAGGAVFGSEATLSVADSLFARNAATSYGGAINNWSYTLPMRVANSSFIGNTAGEYGGAVNAYTLMQIESSRFTGNSSLDVSGGGAGVNTGFVLGSSVAIRKSRFDGNSSMGSGGALQINFLDATSLSSSELRRVVNNRFMRNTASGGGSAVFLSTCIRMPGGSLLLERSNMFSGNRGGRGNVEESFGQCAD
jgi:predicted outer membrane repeat protein